MMFFIPPAILAIEDEDDRSFMENLYRSYYRLMYHEIFTVTSDPWLAEDILQNVVISLIRNLSLCASVMLSISISPTPRTNLEMKERMPLRK